jgi:hypothetical protein
MIEVLQIIAMILFSIFCLSGWIFFAEASTKLKNEREFLQKAKDIQKLLTELKINPSDDDK